VCRVGCPHCRASQKRFFPKPNRVTWSVGCSRKYSLVIQWLMKLINQSETSHFVGFGVKAAQSIHYKLVLVWFVLVEARSSNPTVAWYILEGVWGLSLINLTSTNEKKNIAFQCSYQSPTPPPPRRRYMCCVSDVRGQGLPNVRCWTRRGGGCPKRQFLLGRLMDDPLRK